MSVKIAFLSEIASLSVSVKNASLSEIASLSVVIENAFVSEIASLSLLKCIRVWHCGHVAPLLSCFFDVVPSLF